jgi:hypothetical protein
LGITFQFFLNTEAMRYSLARGESVFVGWRRFSILIPLWFIISLFIPWSLPGFSAGSSDILVSVFPFLPQGLVAVALLLFTGAVLTFGKTLNITMEYIQKAIVLIGLPLMLVLTLLVSNTGDWVDVAWGLVGRGDGFWFVPQGVSLMAFLGAFAYSGAGGNLNLAQSYYIKEKGFGMGKFGAKISSLVSGEGRKKAALSGFDFKKTAGNYKLWNKWWALVNWEHFIVFWTLGLLNDYCDGGFGQNFGVWDRISSRRFSFYF